MPEPSWRTYAAKISECLDKSVEGIIGAGQLFVEAKDKLPHGGFGKMVKNLGLSMDTAEIYMRIARNRVLTKSECIRNLPPSVGTLYELTKLPEDALEQLIADGKIGRGTRREDAAKIVRGPRDADNTVCFDARNNSAALEQVCDDARQLAKDARQYDGVDDEIRRREIRSVIKEWERTLDPMPGEAGR